MARWQRDVGKEGHWRRHLERWQRSGLSIRNYCAAEGLAEHNFHAWKRTLAEREQPLGGRQRRRPRAKPAFVPVHVVADAPSPTSAATIDVILKSGIVLRVGPSCDPQHVRQLVAVLERPAC